jgi:uncharacterized membrane protein YdjX (TVP38/TMEM64 family)
MNDDRRNRGADSVNPRGAGAPSRPRSTSIGSRLLVLGLIVSLFAVSYWLFEDSLSLDRLAEREGQFRAYQERHPVLIYGVAFGTYVVVAGLSLPGAAAMTLIVGWLFGFWRGLVLVSFASTTGATLAFLLSRYLFRDELQRRFGERLHKFNDALAREGAFYLFTLRLIPAVPFFVINAVMGLTPIRTSTFWWVSQIGMLPGTAAYIYAGSRVPSLEDLAKTGAAGVLSVNVLVAFALLGIFPLAVRRLVGWLRPTSAAATHPDRPVTLPDRRAKEP